jgi:hypothetical protein
MPHLVQRMIINSAGRWRSLYAIYPHFHTAWREREA